MRFVFKLASTASFILIVASGCSSSAGGSLDPSESLNALSTTQVQQLCDWAAKLQGGYGIDIPCDAAPTSLETPANQAACVAESAPHFSQASCSTSVGEWMMCVEWRLSNWCSASLPPLPANCAQAQAACYGSESPLDAGTD
jgi:hypothetical protein